MISVSYPKKLYKFSGWELDRHKNLITRNQIYFSSIDNFNDPFENLVPINYGKFDANDWIDKIIQVNTRRGVYNHLSEADKKAHALADYIEQSKKARFTYDEISQTHYEYTKSNFAVYCLSGGKSNILLWSHYSNSHKGISVGFNTARLDDFLKTNYGVDGNEIRIEKVNYYRKFPFYNAKRITDPTEFMLKSLVTKSRDWEYEMEYRLITNVGRINFSIDLPEGIIDEVIMGARFSEEHRKELIQILTRKKPKIKLFQAATSNRRFALSFRRVEY